MYRSGTSSSGILSLIAAIGLATLGLVVLSGIWAGAESDSAALERQRELITQRLREQVDHVAQAIGEVGSGYGSLLAAKLAGASSDPAAPGMAPASADFDSAQAISEIITAVFGYDRAFVVDGAGRLAMRADAETGKRYRWTKPLLLPLLRHLTSSKIQATGGGGDDPAGGEASVSRFGGFAELMRLEGRPTIAGIARISGRQAPGSNEAPTPPAEMRYLIAVRFLDGAILDDLSREQGLNGARFARSADPGDDEVAVQIDAGATGEPIGFIVWSPDLPGSRVIGRLLPALSGSALIIAALFLFLLLRLRGSLIDLKLSEATARRLATHDVLTALPNRALFLERVEQCLANISTSGARSAAALIDLDRFKAVNDSFGHAAGDELIRAAAERMRAIVRPSDILARLGGDEFALLLHDIGDDDARASETCGRLIAELKRPFTLRGNEVVARVGGSIGLAVLSVADGDASETLRHADVALYEAKRRGRGRAVQFEPAMEDGRTTRESMKNQLRAILGDALPMSRDEPSNLRSTDVEEHGELELYFQTIHHASKGHAASGAEALIRWRHPKHGLLAPVSFIPLAEEGGLIDSLGRWVLREACRAATEWSPDTFVAVNVSPSQLLIPGFDEEVGKALLETGLAPTRLELEVTESALVANNSDIAVTLERIRSRGVKISLDDFGTGYSSLSHLMYFGIDRIKIDRSFVSMLGTRADGTAIVSALVSLGRTLGISTTAEGIETEAQRDFLIALGCTDLQGYLFSRPAPLRDLQRFEGFGDQLKSGDFKQTRKTTGM